MLFCCNYTSHHTGFAPPNLLQKLVWIIAPSGGLRDKEKTKTKAQTNAASLHENQDWDRWEKYQLRMLVG